MLRSMTGFGGAQAVIEGIHYSVEIRSVNGRYFKANIKLPDMWSHAEAEIDKLLRHRLNRGSVVFSLRMTMAEEAAAYSVNVSALRKYVAQARAALPDGVVFEAGNLLLLPGVCQPPVADEVVEKSWPALQQTIGEAVDHLIAMRQTEGQALLTDLLSQCRDIQTHLQAVEARKDTVVADYQKRLISRVNELINAARIQVNQEDLIREVAVFAERSDINEEIARLRSHLEQFEQAANQHEQAGRKLDFISQEMLREANTIASKANDAQIARAIVEIKGGIDRIKEQVQNIE